VVDAFEYYGVEQSGIVILSTIQLLWAITQQQPAFVVALLYFDDITQQSAMINKYAGGGGSGGVNSLCVFSGDVKKRGGI
jgi:hypothetical protein